MTADVDAPTDGRAGPEGAAPPRRRRSGSAVDDVRDLLAGAWAQAVVFALLATVAVTGSSPDRYVGDNRFDQYWAPGHRLVRSLFLWDGTRGLGATREDLWPIEVAPLALLRGLGLGPLATQRVWHVVLLVVAATGAAAVLRAVRTRTASPATALGPFLAGLVYGFGAYSHTYFLPTNLYVAYALAPWVVLCALRGAVSERPWRSAAVAALLIGALGNTDTPGVVMAMLAVPVVAVWSSSAAGRGWRPGLGWLARAAGLGLAVSVAALWKSWAGASVLAQRLGSTESPETVAAASSWSETLRGLGFWLSYYRGPDLARPQGAAYFADPVVVAATFVPVLLALAALLLPEVRSRGLWALCIVGSAVVMVGLHPVADPVPLGALLDRAFEASSTLSGFRSTYKAGAGLVLGVAVLTGIGVDALSARLEQHGRRATLLRVSVVALLLVGGLPFWTGDLYDDEATSAPVPSYWEDAARAVNDLPGDGRILVLPASTRAIYRWGWVGDDILDSLLTRPQAVDVTIPLSTPEAADLLAAVSRAVDDARHRDGSLAPVLRRLGIDHVLVRNDLDADRTRTTFPARLSRLRDDPGLQRIATFGSRQEAEEARGQASSSGGDDDPGDLPPLELYALTDPGPVGPRLASVAAPLVLSGSGDALPPLAASGDLDRAGTVRYGPDLDDDELVAALDDDGGRVVLTDTNRRRVTVVNSLVRDESWTLAAGEDLDREGAALFDAPGTQTVAWYADATRISSDGFPRTAAGSQPWTRPAMAFDGDGATAWQTVELSDQEGTTLRVDLREPEEVGTVRLDPVGSPNDPRRLTEVEVRTSDGTRRTVDLAEGPAEVDLASGPSEWIEIEITGVTGDGFAPVGLTEVEVEGLDLREWIQLPDDLARRADGSDEVAAVLEGAPLAVTLTRDRPEAPFPVEPLLRRRFRLPSDRRLALRGEVVPFRGEEVDQVREMAEGCVGGVLDVDGEDVPVTLADPDQEVVLGAAYEVVACDPVVLDAGWHRLAVDRESSLDRLVLDDGDAPPAPGPAGTVEVLADGPEDVHLRVDAPDGGVLLTGESWDDRWVATVDGEDLGAASPHDTLGGWELPPGEDLDVRLEFAPARIHRLAMVVSLVAAAGCVALAVTGGPRRRRRRT
ncbi:alpha-(1-_3)-arabinofuranosyltransferase family protein [Iamia majanohamensis]|uniref:Alpha-(1->3)-arabinofuranosyltransferase family protein n=1 Tax=Iamia majanohamensis TaxID=467976 RepID=A0AAE9Y5Z0_9ACTN|nr:alpha-(1->3)-arabinofuranosyltransferase family protein [Iamia majanohamensis]WCO67475.1 alpha-(1->3)-arabinofuranosyltransferase family protein [Iamia majanohamensis]